MIYKKDVIDKLVLRNFLSLSKSDIPKERSNLLIIFNLLEEAYEQRISAQPGFSVPNQDPRAIIVTIKI